VATEEHAGPTSMEIKRSALELIGETPLVRLSRLDPGLTTPLVAKIEFLNPGGSVKDRPAVSMIDAAERSGELPPRGTLIEPTSGNTGLGLAMVAALRGYKVIAVMPDKMSREKIDTLRAFGAEVVVCPTDVPPDSPQSYYRVADRLTEEIDGAFQPNQYFNRANPEAHYRSTGPEIWRQTSGGITHLVVGVGTGGTISGVGRYLKERKPDVQVIGADPEGSLYSGGPVHPYRVEGIGEDFWPESLDRGVIDRYVRVSDRESFLAARRLVAREGLFAGGSSGTAVHAAVQIARELDDPGALVVTLLPDGGRPYLSKVFNDHWMRVSHVPVVSAEDASVFVGAVSERGLLWASAEHPGILKQQVTDVLEAPLPELAPDDPAEDAIRILEEGRQAVIVISGGRPLGILTPLDLIEALNR
jgi:cystathionine beta-synthase